MKTTHTILIQDEDFSRDVFVELRPDTARRLAAKARAAGWNWVFVDTDDEVIL